MFVSFENLFQYTPMEYYIISHVLTLGFAVMLAALFYFVMTVRTVAPRYRISSVLSVVVMVSAFLILLAQQLNWAAAFDYNPVTGLYERAVTATIVNGQEIVTATEPFTNGYRYLNWLIDVPMLLFQILFIVEITKERRATLRNWFFFSGAMMIVTGYIGQFYETADDLTPFYVWGAISTVFFFHVLYLIYRVIQESRKSLSAEAGRVMNTILIVFVVSWFLYPGAYLMPVLLNSVEGVVGRQITFTIADVTSKVLYGVLLTQVAQIRSREEGFVSDMGTPDSVPAPAVGD
ncbi:MAG: bacteriorhodopsin-like [Anaerolineae bacterium]